MPPSPKDAMAAIYAGEVRSALSRMPLTERASAVERAIGEGDDAFAVAALTGSPVLVGLGRAEQRALRDVWQRKKHGPTLQRIAKLKAALDEHNRLSSLLSGWSYQLFADDNAAISAAQESERIAREILAG